MTDLQTAAKVSANLSRIKHVFDFEFPTQFVYGHGSAPALNHPKSRAEIVSWADSHYYYPKLISSECVFEPVSYTSLLFVVIGQEALSGSQKQDVYIFGHSVAIDGKPWRMLVAGMSQITGTGTSAVDILLSHATKTFVVVDQHSKELCSIKAPKAIEYLERLSSLEHRK